MLKDKAMGYIRVSKLDDESEAESPELQENSFYKYATEKGHEFLGFESDLDKSGYRIHFSKREGLMKLLQLASQGTFKYLYVFKFSRLGRKLARDIIKSFEAHGVSVISVTQDIDVSKPSGRFVRSIILDVDEFYSEDLAEWTLETHANLARKGKPTGGPPKYGYTRDPVTKKESIVEEEAKTIRHMVEARKKGWGWKTIVDYLNHDLKIPTRTGKKWSDGMIAKWMSYPDILAWAGYLVYGKERGKTRVRSSEDELIITPDARPAIITLEDCLAIRKINEVNHRPFKAGNPRVLSSSYLLSGMAYCAICGMRMNGATGQRGNYICSGYLRHGKGHHDPYFIDKSNMERTVWEAVIEHFFDNDDLFKEYEEKFYTQTQSDEQKKDRLKAIEKREKELEQEFLEMTKMKVKRMIKDEDYNLFYSELDKERLNLEKEKGKIQKELSPQKDKKLSIDKIRAAVKEAEIVLKSDKVPVEEKRNILSMFVERVDAPILIDRKKHVKISFHITPDDPDDLFPIKLKRGSSKDKPNNYIQHTGASSPIA